MLGAGIGKSTLLGLIGGTLEPSTGHINRNPRTRFATFSQHHVDGLDLALNPLQYLCRCFAGTPEQDLRHGAPPPVAAVPAPCARASG